MRIASLLTALTIILLLFFSSFHSVSFYTELPTKHEDSPQISDTNQSSNTQPHHEENGRQDEEHSTWTREEKNMQSEPLQTNQTCEENLENEEQFILLNSTQNLNDTSSMPDGRIYLTGDEPYPYIPTQTPKGWGNLPILPQP